MRRTSLKSHLPKLSSTDSLSYSPGPSSPGDKLKFISNFICFFPIHTYINCSHSLSHSRKRKCHPLCTQNELNESVVNM